MPFLSVADGQLYYEVHGEGPAIVLAHGIGGNHAAWYQQIPVFSQSYTLVTFDHRGFGRSEDRGGLGRSAFVDDLTTLLDHLTIEQAALVGQSTGGGTCVGFTSRHPKRVAALVMADTLHGLTEAADVREMMSIARNEMDGLSQLERVLGEKTRREQPALAALYDQIASFNDYDRRTLPGSFTPIEPSALAALKVPTLFIVGQEDQLFPPTAVQRMQAQIPGSFYIEVSDSGHSAYFERPTEFNDSVLTFLGAVGFKGRTRAAHSNAPGYQRVG
ncbi:MAG TPA: alpha/beta hydrolase [Steroidobacteraceae bacterium]|nr:alpha/beta hydrolase [Steroidobacteraceae bacterium]HRX89512.1 alpha/beta hydrolase [Steroidobacteraceae bacterium]